MAGKDAIPARVGLVLALAVLGISTAALLVRLAEGVHPVVLGFWRNAGAALLLAPGIRRVSLRDGLLIGLAGLCLAVHFWLWFASLQYTGVLRSTVMVCLAPIWTALLAWLFHGERPRRRYGAGVAVALAGVALLTLGGVDSTEEGAVNHILQGGTLLGDLLAIAGGTMSAAYWVIGRGVRQRVAITSYAPLVCAAAALCLLPAALLLRAPLVGFPNGVWLAMGAMVLGPQIIGHNGINFALRYLPAAVVSTAALLEPVGASLLAFIFLHESPAAWGMGGAGLILIGVWWAVISPERRPRKS